MIPSGIEIGPATIEAIETILARPRALDVHRRSLVGEAPGAWYADQTGWIVRLHGDPIVWLGYSTSETTLTFHTIATPEAHRFPVFLTKLGRHWVRGTAEAHSDLPCIAWVLPGTSGHRWLRTLGFRDGRPAHWNGVPVLEMVL
jgi:hypothetical protein